MLKHIQNHYDNNKNKYKNDKKRVQNTKNNTIISFINTNRDTLINNNTFTNIYI